MNTNMLRLLRSLFEYSFSSNTDSGRMSEMLVLNKRNGEVHPGYGPGRGEAYSIVGYMLRGAAVTTKDDDYRRALEDLAKWSESRYYVRTLRVKHFNNKRKI